MAFSLLKRVGIDAVLAKGIGGSVIVRISGAALAFGIQVALARVIGAEQFGIYVLALSWVGILAVVARLGLDVSVVRFVPQYRLRAEWPLLHGLLRSSVLAVGLAAGILGFAFMLGLRVAPHWFLGGETGVGVVAVLLLPLVALSYLIQGVLRGLRQVVYAEAVESLIRPALLVALLALASLTSYRPSAKCALTVNAAGTAISLILGGFWVFRVIVDETRGTKPQLDIVAWRATAVPFMFMAGMNLVLDQTDVLIIGAFLGPEQVAAYAAGARIASQVLFLLSAADVTLAPIVAEHYAAGRITELQRTLTLSSRIVVSIAVLFSIFLILFGRTLLGMFGEGFQAGYLPMVTLLVAKLVNAFAGSVGTVMNMTGNQRMTAIIIGSCAALNLLLSALLTPRFGLQGAAISTSVSIMAWNFSMLSFVRYKLGVDTTPLGRVPARRLVQK
jgi:O-antigen/teichoic acid export membrane protein